MFRITGPVADGLPPQKASNVQNVSVSWHYHVLILTSGVLVKETHGWSQDGSKHAIMQGGRSLAGHDLVDNRPHTSQYNHADHQTNVYVQTFAMVMVFPEDKNNVFH